MRRALSGIIQTDAVRSALTRVVTRDMSKKNDHNATGLQPGLQTTAPFVKVGPKKQPHPGVSGSVG